jgi:lipoprotein-anchoring transpeptidase ErfK/SrfK
VPNRLRTHPRVSDVRDLSEENTVKLKKYIIGGAAAVACAATAVVVAISMNPGTVTVVVVDSVKPSHSASIAPAGPPLPADLSGAPLTALPAATYDAVIPGLVDAPANGTIAKAYTVLFDTAVYGADRSTPIAKLTAKNFLGEPTVVVPTASEGDWSLVLVASRRILPSKATAASPAPAQSAAWIPTKALQSARSLPNRIVVSISAQTLTVTDAAGTVQQTFTVGVGTPDTPTPTGVTGYLQARYLDPAQGQAVHPIQLTSLHATGADEPYGGSDGGLIGIHYQAVSSGAVSHGCIRLDEAAIDAVNGLALGTPVTIIP